jgi:hypothetical protein
VFLEHDRECGHDPDLLFLSAQPACVLWSHKYTLH